MKVSTILSTKRQRLITIEPGQTLQEAAVLLSQHNIGALIVVNEDVAPIGILSERDIVRRLGQTPGAPTALVSEVMTADIVTGLPDDDLMSVAHTMTERRFRHLPIVTDNQLIGMISIGDVMKAQRDLYRGERNTLETQILAE
ncbi:MAG: CBS domain-containing protein [Chloroflexi bacterium]|nr:MAG: CBS domain-containing protein [Chloroflexota bacterium]